MNAPIRVWLHGLDTYQAFSTANLGEHCYVPEQRALDAEAALAALHLRVRAVGQDVGFEFSPTGELYLLCNDVFVPASDGEAVTDAQIPEILALTDEHGWMGAMAWIGQQRGVDPWRNFLERHGETYRDAKRAAERARTSNAKRLVK